MNYKWLYNRFISLLFKPSSTWREIAKEDGGVDVMGSYFYPLAGLAGTISFLAILITEWVGDDAAHPFVMFREALIGCCVTCVPIIVSFFVSVFMLGKVARALFDFDSKEEAAIYKLVAYSMTVLCVTYTVLAFPVDFKILVWLCQVYTMYLIWEGCSCLFKLDDNKKLVFTVMAFVSMVGVSGVTYLLFNKFM